MRNERIEIRLRNERRNKIVAIIKIIILSFVGNLDANYFNLVGSFFLLHVTKRCLSKKKTQRIETKPFVLLSMAHKY